VPVPDPELDEPPECPLDVPPPDAPPLPDAVPPPVEPPADPEVAPPSPFASTDASDPDSNAEPPQCTPAAARAASANP
jgi:hypothetical protein